MDANGSHTQKASAGELNYVRRMMDQLAAEYDPCHPYAIKLMDVLAQWEDEAMTLMETDPLGRPVSSAMISLFCQIRDWLMTLPFVSAAERKEIMQLWWKMRSVQSLTVDERREVQRRLNLLAITFADRKSTYEAAIYTYEYNWQMENADLLAAAIHLDPTYKDMVSLFFKYEQLSNYSAHLAVAFRDTCGMWEQVEADRKERGKKLQIANQ